MNGFNSDHGSESGGDSGRASGQPSAADRYLDTRTPVDAWISLDNEHADAIARCDAVMALTPKLRESADIGWAFEEASRLARTPPRTHRGWLRWYQRPELAWASAGVAIAAAAAVSIVAVTGWLAGPAPPVDADLAPVASAAFATFIAPPTLDQIRRLDGIRAVVRIANQMTVDGRSLVVLPFTDSGTAGVADGRAGSADGGSSDIAQAIYLDLVRQLTEIPGFYVIDPSVAAAWTGAEFSPEQIAFSLGVRGVVQGRVSAVGGDVRVDVRLTDAARNGLTFDKAYERPVGEAALIRNDITSGLLDAMTEPQVVTY